MRSLSFVFVLFFLPLALMAQVSQPADSTRLHHANRLTTEPPGYYAAAAGLNCAALKTALRDIITTGMTPKTYGDLWTQYLLSDVKPREVGPGTSPLVIWDIYSDNPTGADPYNFTPGPVSSGGQQDNGTAVSGEGQLYNREHSIPQSWFGASASPGSIGPESDYFHIFPTDKQVNANRANFTYGKVNAPTTISQNGGKLGPNTWPGLAGTSFEPIDSFKGDLARAFLYFVTRYQNNMAGWESLNAEGNKAFDGTAWPSVELPYLQLMLNWHAIDPVSQKEADRNDAGYLYQGNRNPFIDHPEFAGQVWGAACGLLLPVDLLSFTAAYKEQKVLLKWSIDRADGLSHFIIERSTDGGNSFSEAGRMDWHNGVNEYQFADDVSSFDGRLQYRLRIADLNAVYKYSPVVMVTLPATDALFVLTPNPSSGKLQLVFREVNNLEWKISVIDLAGKINYSSVLQQGQSVYNLPDMMLPSGVYILRLQHDRSLQQVKFIIQR